MKRLVTFERVDDEAEVLIITNGWPHESNRMYAIFTQREVESLKKMGLRYEVMFIRGYRSPVAYVVAAMQLAFWNLFPRHPYRLVHAHMGETSLPASFYFRAPLIVTYYGDDLLGTPLPDGSISLGGLVRRTILRWWSRRAAATITQSRELEAALPRSVQARNSIIPSGVDRGVFRPIERDRARGELGWGTDERTVLFLADPAVARKRYPLAEAACAQAATQVPALRLRVASGVDPGNTPLLLNAADCLLLTSKIEGSPNVVKEAVFCGLPVVTTRVGDVEEVLRDVWPSYVCDDNPPALAAALVECLTERRRSNGPSAASWLASDQVTGRILAKYREVAGKAVAPDVLGAYEGRGDSRAS